MASVNPANPTRNFKFAFIKPNAKVLGCHRPFARHGQSGAEFSDWLDAWKPIADEFPNDRLSTTYFRRDFNFSLYSYERFYNFPPKEELLRMWDADTQLLTAQYETRPNLRYFIPYYRSINDSHCTTVLNFAGSDIQDHDMTLAQWVNDFVGDKTVESMIEAPVPGEDE